MHFSKAALAALTCGTAILAALPGTAVADVLVDNVEGLTPDGKGGVTRFDGFLIDDAGRIAQVF